MTNVLLFIHHLAISSSGTQYAGLARSLTALMGPERIEVKPDNVSETFSVTFRACTSFFSDDIFVSIPFRT